MNHFFALPIPPHVSLYLAALVADWSARLPGDILPQWYAPEDCHITLKFLGDIDVTHQAELIAAAGGLAAGGTPFPVRLAAPGGFPDLVRPFVLWAGVERSENLSRLAADLGTAMSRLGFAPERRAYLPHVTLARCRARRARFALPTPDESERTFPQWQAHGFALMQTLPPAQRQNGAKCRYNIVQAFPFRNTRA
jgi:2'-5' RNA ligase